MRAPIHPDEPERLALLRAYSILDTDPEPFFDSIVDEVVHLFHCPIAFVALADEARLWLKAKSGIEAAELNREQSFCSHTILGSDVVVVEDATTDPRFADSTYVTQPPHVRFYVGAPLVGPSGLTLGTLCAVDVKPRKPESYQVNGMRELAESVMTALELRRLSLELLRLHHEHKDIARKLADLRTASPPA